jgi:hypothetical protein
LLRFIGEVLRGQARGAADVVVDARFARVLFEQRL